MSCWGFSISDILLSPLRDSGIWDLFLFDNMMAVKAIFGHESNFPYNVIMLQCSLSRPKLCFGMRRKVIEIIITCPLLRHKQ
ncbi:hypothetical protein HMPREF1141_2222 [Clostridium sp. MSTE9]|nr:hypothetical protein HMPREF1141_2222 [Clostridium sp. MSTE9]